jgi:hypothetical protein
VAKKLKQNPADGAPSLHGVASALPHEPNLAAKRALGLRGAALVAKVGGFMLGDTLADVFKMIRRAWVPLVGAVLLVGCHKERSKPPMDPLLLDVSPDNANRWLSWWTWATGEDARPVAVTRFCDWLFERSDGTIHHLSIQDGSVERVSGSRKALADALATVEARDRYLSATFVQRAERAGKRLAPGQCYSYVIPPVIGGSFDESNVRPYGVGAYQLVIVQLTQLVKLVPKGTATNRLQMQFRKDGTLDLLLDGVSVR